MLIFNFSSAVSFGGGGCFLILWVTLVLVSIFLELFFFTIRHSGKGVTLRSLLKCFFLIAKQGDWGCACSGSCFDSNGNDSSPRFEETCIELTSM